MLPMSSGREGGKGQSLEDKLYALKYFISGSRISFIVLKATTSELCGPKKKHLNCKWAPNPILAASLLLCNDVY